MSTERLERPLRVLVADSNRDGAETMALLLRLWGYEATVAPTGPAALAQAAAEDPDVVLTDLVLPQLDGFQLAGHLRGRVPLLALTGMDQETARRRALEAGFDFFFCKPAEPEEIHRVLEGVKAERSMAVRAIRVDAAHSN